MIATRARAVAVSALIALAACGGSAAEERPQGPTKEDKIATARRLFEQAKEAEEAGQPNIAERKYERALRLRPNHYETNLRTGKFFIAGGRAERAVEIGEAYVRRNPGDPRGYHMLADAEIEAGDYRGARETLGELITIDDEDAGAYEKRGRAAVLAGDLDAGVADLRKAIELKPDDPNFLVSLGSALLRAEKLEEASLHLRSALQVDETHARAYLFLGIALRQQYEPKLALSNHLKAVRYAPNSSRAHFELGVTQNLIGDNLAAEESLKKAVDLDPKSAQNWYAYGDIQRVQEKYDGAVPAYRKALELDPEHPKATNKLGIALFHAGELSEAEVVLTRAIRMNGEDPYPYFNIGLVYEGQEKYSLAISSFKKFLELAPEGDGDIPVARKKIRRLRRKVRRR